MNPSYAYLLFPFLCLGGFSLVDVIFEFNIFIEIIIGFMLAIIACKGLLK